MPGPQSSIRIPLCLTLAAVIGCAVATGAPDGARLSSGVSAALVVASIAGIVSLILSARSRTAIVMGVIVCAALAIIGLAALLPLVQQPR